MSAELDLPPVAILSGGLATRLRPMTEDVPKAMLDVAGEPFIGHQLRLLRAAGLRRVVLCVGFLGERIQAYVADGERFGLHVEYAFDGARLLGTAGALRQALPLLGDTFYVLYGDSYLRCDYAAIGRAYFASGKPALMTVHRNENAFDQSNIELSNGTIVAYDKGLRSQRMHHIDYGLSVLSASVFSDLKANEPSDLSALFQGLVQRGRMAAYEVVERFYEIGSAAGLAELRSLLSQHITSGGRSG